MNLFISWWLFALRGLLAICFGVLALIWPQQTVSILVQVFGVLALADGILAFIVGIGIMEYNERWWMALSEGVAGIIIGLLMLESLNKITLVYFIAFAMVIVGVIELVSAIQLRRVITGEWTMLFCAALSIFFGVVLFAVPSAAASGRMWLIGTFAIILGILLNIVAFRIRSLQPEIEVAVQRYSRINEENHRLRSELHQALSRESSNGNEA